MKLWFRTENGHVFWNLRDWVSACDYRGGLSGAPDAYSAALHRGWRDHSGRYRDCDGCAENSAERSQLRHGTQRDLHWERGHFDDCHSGFWIAIYTIDCAANTGVQRIFGGTALH